MEKNLRMTGFTKLIKSVAPNTYEYYSCTVKCRCSLGSCSNYDRILHWQYKTTDKLIDYLNSLGLKEFICQERIDYFMHYLLTIYLLDYECVEKDTVTIQTPTFERYPYFIHQNLKNFKKIDTPSRFVRQPILHRDMSVFFCLFLRASDYLDKMGYGLTGTQRSKIEALNSQTNLSLRESFERLVRIFFS